MTTSSIPNIAQGSLAAHFLLDVADTIDIDAIAKMSGGASERAPLKLRPESLPNYINFPVPPLVMALPDMEILGRTAKVRLKVYDYGVMAVRILLPYEGDWANFEATARSFCHSEELVRAARKLHEALLPQFSSAISKPHAKHLFEDHFVYTVNRFDAEVLGDDLLAKHSHSLAALLRAEAKPLAKQEIEETLRLHISYFTSDLCVVEWDTAFVYDSADSAEGIADISNSLIRSWLSCGHMMRD